MLKLFDKYLSGMEWFIFERGWDPECQNVTETQLSLGNGYIGSRAVLEETPINSCPGTFFAGLYDTMGAQVTELVNAPNPIFLRISVKGEKLGVQAMDTTGHKRILDMRHGLLARETLFSSAKKKRFTYQSLRFFSMHDKHTAVMRSYITPQNEDTTFIVDGSIDASVYNKGLVTEGRKKHFHIFDFEKSANINYLCMKTLENEVLISYAYKIEITVKNKTTYAKRRVFNLHLKKGETACITKYISFYTSYDVKESSIKDKTVSNLKNSLKKGFETLIEEHRKSWHDLWKLSDFSIEGDPDIQRAIRFNIYHLLICGNAENENVSIGAKTLTGEGYRGHIFWDTEIFILPFFIYTNPKIAKNLLLYRYHRLNEARKIAKEKGYKGAMFPWESAFTGKEVTPSWYKEPDGKIGKVLTGGLEHHITADISYGIIQYYKITGNYEFMLKYGLTMLIASARFWASRVNYVDSRKRYEIKNVIGPDEFHENVNNNAYTNLMAKWTIENTLLTIKHFSKTYSRKTNAIKKKLRLSLSELNHWRTVSNLIFTPNLSKAGIIEEFDGYFKLKKLPLPQSDKNYIPLHPKGFNQEKLGKTQYVKQADVIMAMYLLRDSFNVEQLRKNYHFYESRTLHKSSLSISTHSIIASEINEYNSAYKYFLTSAYADMKNIYGNTSDGMHAAALGGAWQAAFNGFAGIRIKDTILSVNPKLPASWKKIKFHIKWKGYGIDFIIDKTKIQAFFAVKQENSKLPIHVYGTITDIKSNVTNVFYKNKLNQ